MICPMLMKGHQAKWIAEHPKNFECVKECAWLVQDPRTNVFSCAMACLAADGRGIPYVTLAEQFPGTYKLTG